MTFFDHKPNLWTHDCTFQPTCAYQVNGICMISGLYKKNYVVQRKILTLVNIIKSPVDDTKVKEIPTTPLKEEPISSELTESCLFTSSSSSVEDIEDVKLIGVNEQGEYASVRHLGHFLYENKWSIKRSYCRWKDRNCTNRACGYAHSFSELADVFEKQKVIDFFKNASIKSDNQERPTFFILRRVVDNFHCTTKKCNGEIDKNNTYIRYYNYVNKSLRYPDYVSCCLKCCKKLVLSVYI